MRERTSPGLGRRALGATAAVLASMLWVHGLAAVSRGFFGGEVPSLGLTLGAVVVAATGAGTMTSRRWWAVPLLASLIALVALALESGQVAAPLALVPGGVLAVAAGRALAFRLPESFDGWFGRRRVLTALWVLMAALSVVQVGRLATYMSDTETDWFLSTRNPLWAKHECLSAYLYGAELASKGDPNIYDASHYPALDPEARPETEIAGMAIEDPFQYPPQFLLLPRLALSLSQDYSVLRVVWFSVQTSLFLVIAGWLALWMGGRAGRVGFFLLPLALTAFPALHAFQYGQFHVMAVALGVGAMLAFDRERSVLGGAMLATAVLAKLFPAFLLIPLLVQRRFREVGYTALFAGAITVLALAVFGPQPFAAFFDYHLPRLASGKAFAFGEAWPEIRELIIADNQGVLGFFAKLGELGVPGANEVVGAWVNRAVAVGLAVVLLVGGRALGEARPADRAVAWISIVGLGSMLSTGAFGDYVPSTATWLLTLAAWRMADAPRLALLLVPSWIFQFLLLGTTPILEWADFGVLMPLSTVAVVLLFATFGWGLARVRPGARAKEPTPALPRTSEPALS